MAVRNKLLLSLFLVILLIGVISANLGPQKQNDCVQIKVLSNCSSVNITEVGSRTQNFIINEEMQHLGGQTFNYTFCNTSEIAEYTYSWNDPCIDCALEGTCGNSFEVTPNGKEKITNGQAILYIFILLFSISLLSACLFFAIRIPGNNGKDDEGKISINDLKYLKFALWFVSYLVLYFIITIIYELCFSYLYIEGLMNIFKWLYLSMTAIIGPLLIATIFIIIAQKLADNKTEKLAERGLDKR